MFDWNQYVRLAEDLAGSAEESRLRSATSRSYYGAYCLVRNWLAEHDPVYQPPREHAHWYVWDRFEKQSYRIARSIAAKGRRLFNSRNDADYEDSIPDPKEQAQMALANAKKIIELLTELNQIGHPFL